MVTLTTSFFRLRADTKKGAVRRPVPVRIGCSSELKIGRGFTAVAAGFDVVGDFLVVVHRGQACALDGRDVEEDVLAARLGERR